MDVTSGKADLAAVDRLVKELRDYKAYVDRTVDGIMAKTENLRSAWDDPQYKKVLSRMKEISDSIKKNLEVFSQSADMLERKAEFLRSN